MLRRVVIVDNIAKGVYGAIIIIISAYVIIIEGFISALRVARRDTNSYNRKGFSETITITRF